jgi:transcriptional regulator of acetoin/glycerol metabolism
VAHAGETVDRPWHSGHGPTQKAQALPGILLVFSDGKPALEPIPLGGRPLTIGRGSVGPLMLDDAAMSRRHAEVSFAEGDWQVRDLGSRNGTAVDARPLLVPLQSPSARLLRCGDSLFLLCPDLRPFVRARVEIVDGVVIGPRMKRLWDEIAGAGDVLHITGETGAGKELAARRFHKSGPFVAVNCAAIPGAIAERLLFGAKRGAFSGADADSDGYLQAADGGTLFLDEVAELDAGVQAKLLRVLETKEVLQLGSTRPSKVEVRVCSATHNGLQARVADGKFREDLYFRLGRPELRVPPLRERAEEIPWLIQTCAAAHVSLVERAVAQPWPGNVRELLLEVREAARRAGKQGSRLVEARHLDRDEAASDDAFDPHDDGDDDDDEPRRRGPPVTPPPREVLEAALAENGGNLSAAARALGVHRTQLRRWLQRD